MPEASCGEGSIYICTGDEGGSMRDFYSTVGFHDTIPYRHSGSPIRRIHSVPISTKYTSATTQEPRSWLSKSYTCE